MQSTCVNSVGKLGRLLSWPEGFASNPCVFAPIPTDLGLTCGIHVLVLSVPVVADATTLSGSTQPVETSAAELAPSATDTNAPSVTTEPVAQGSHPRAVYRGSRWSEGGANHAVA